MFYCSIRHPATFDWQFKGQSIFSLTVLCVKSSQSQLHIGLSNTSYGHTIITYGKWFGRQQMYLVTMNTCTPWLQEIPFTTYSAAISDSTCQIFTTQMEMPPHHLQELSAKGNKAGLVSEVHIPGLD